MISTNKKKKLIASLIFFSFLFSLSFAEIVSATDDIVAMREKINLEAKNSSLLKALQHLADELEIEISVSGATPKILRNLSLSEMPLEQTIKRLMEIYGVTNHATIYDFKKQMVLLTILEVSSTEDNKLNLGRLQTPKQVTDGILNKKQISNLKKLNMNEGQQLLTSNQELQLKELKIKIDEKGAEGSLILTDDQVQKIEGSELSNLMEQGQQLLSPEQAELLNQKQLAINSVNNSRDLLTHEQIASLRMKQNRPPPY